MKKGLNVTLMTVALAMLSLQAMATAPVISDIPSPIVGQNQNVTGATPYVYPDVFDLDAKVTDDTTADADIIWSYTVVGTPIYRINNVDPIVVGTDNIVTGGASGAKRLNGATKDPKDGDGASKTITIRNVKYAPITGTGSTPSGTGIIDSQVITLFASDGTTFSAAGKSFLAYTEVGGTNHISTGTVQPTPVTPPAIPGGWTFNLTLALSGTVTSGTSGGTAVCIDSSAAGINMANWITAPAAVPLVKNGVYKIRLKVQGSQSTAGHTPFWDFVIDNYSADGSVGRNLYGADFLFLDNEGGANAALNKTGGGTDFYVWWAPAAIQLASFNDTTNGIFATSQGNNRDFRLTFRVLDVNNNGGITADADSGSLCLTQMQIDRFDMANMQVVGNVYSNTSLAAANFQAKPLLGSTVAYNSGVCTITNVTASGNLEFAECYPGDATLSVSDPNSYPDNFPVQWNSNTLYMTTVGLSSTTPANQYDVYWVGMDAATNELLSENFVTGEVNKTAVPGTSVGTFTHFMWSHNETQSAVTNFHRLRPYFHLANAPGLNAYTNTGSVAVSWMKVDKVKFE